MPAANQNSNDQSAATFSIKADGQAIPLSHNVASVVVFHAVNRVSFARVIMLDGEASSGEFRVSNLPDFEPGKTLEVLAGHGQDTKSVFKGIVVKHSIQLKANNSTLLVIDARHEAVKMTKLKSSRIVRDQKDSDLFQTLVSANGLTADAADTTVTHEGLVQNHCSDWDMAVARAEANGMIVLCEPGKLLLKKPDFASGPVMELRFGLNLFEMNLEMDSRNLLDSVELGGWDFSELEAVKSEGTAPEGWQQPGNISSSNLAGASGPASQTGSAQVSAAEDELRALATGVLLKHQLSKIRGKARCKGDAQLKPGINVTLAGCGDRFNGTHFVGGVRHEINQGSWFSDVEFGMAPVAFMEQFEVNQVPASGLIPAINGLQVGMVTQLASDPKDEDRVQVKLPTIDETAEGIWARQALLDAGKERGSFFRPEIGDEVVVGFINDDPRYPVILGMMNGPKNTAVIKATDDNHLKGFVTREKLKVWFDDENKIIEVSTPGGRKLMLDDKEGAMMMKDDDGNEFTINKDGITLKSVKDIILKATGNVSIEGVEVKAEASATGKFAGGSSAEFSSGGTTAVKGSMVNIN